MCRQCDTARRVCFGVIVIVTSFLISAIDCLPAAGHHNASHRSASNRTASIDFATITTTTMSSYPTITRTHVPRHHHRPSSHYLRPQHVNPNLHHLTGSGGGASVGGLGASML